MTDGNQAHPANATSAFPTTAASSAEAPAEQAAPVASPVAAPAEQAAPAGVSRETGKLRKWFWLDDRIAEAKRLCFCAGRPGFGEFELARQARSGIVQIGETSENSGAVLLLERIEVLSLLRAHLLTANLPQDGIGCLTAEDWEHLRTLPRVIEQWNELSTVQQTAVTAAFGPDAERALLALDVKSRRYLAAGLRKLAAGLSEPLEFEANRVGRALFARWARLGAAAVALLAVGAGAYGIYAKATAKPNIALHRPVTTSSRYGAEGNDLSLLVDGDDTNLGFHTQNGPGEWCAVDLGAEKTVSKVVVTNRPDCCQERAVPLKLLVSSDGQNYKQIALRREQFDVWTVSDLNVRARYVKLQLTGRNFLHLSEVAVY